MGYTGDAAYKRAQKALRRRARRDDEPCCFCGGPIDWTAKWWEPWAFSADHPEPVSRGGKVVGQKLRTAHRRCNTSVGNRQGAAYAQETEVNTVTVWRSRSLG